ncbi:MAG: ABC transporter permease [Dehalogenimonas sp.]|uniref:ABC transporter permease n=1 Tax=Candidatus Dehalogenimonas loeffleri TaxID=3127115 RepID=A0ABZ2J4W2_9CHLR|nr:ABC transporter permease [Dehalogenimonas sp.]
MNGFKTLLSKEWREQFRTFRLLIVSGIFLFFGLLTPVMIKYLPEIIKLAGEDLGTIELPPPTALQALTEYSATALQMGLLVAVLVTMGAIAAERRSGTAAMTLSKPVGTGAFVTAKMLAISFSFIIGLVLGGIGAYGYTWLLIEEGNLGGFIGQTALLAVYLMFCINVTLIFSAVFKNSLAAGGAAIAVLLAGAGLGAVPWVGRVMPGSLTSWGNHLAAGESGGAEWLALAVTVVLIIGGTWLAAWILKGKEI